MNGASWKGDRPHDRFGPKVRRWLALRLRVRLLGTVMYAEGKLTDAEVAELVAWYMEQPTVYARWKPYETFSGKERSLGAWCFNDSAFVRDFADGVKAARRRIHAARFATLDEWIDAERSTVARSYSLGTGDGGAGKLPDKLRARLLTAARDRQKRWPVNCRDCDETFRWNGGRASRIRCAECATRHKASQNQRSSRKAES
jgi:hypothetical protein